MKGLKILLAIVSFLGISVLAYAQNPGMMGSGMMGQKAGSGISSDNSAGSKIFDDLCKRCHPGGGNIIVPGLPLKGSSKLSDFKTFLSFIRSPKMPDGSEGVMPTFPRRQISDREAKKLYQYVAGTQTSGSYGGGYGMGTGMMGSSGGGYGMGSGMMGGYGRGYGMGPGMMGGGMMGGYGMGPGMMGGYQSEECQKFLDETSRPRKELHNKRFEYSEAYRNPKTTQETLLKLDKEIFDLQNKIYSASPLGCRW